MNLEELQAKGGLVSPTLVPRSGVWKHNGQEDTVDFFVKRASFGAVDRAFLDKDKSSSSALICECIRLGEEGEESLTYEQAYALDAGLAACFLEAVTAVNELEQKDSPKS